MMNEVHHTQQELALHAMQRLSVQKANSIHEHLQTCSVCRQDFADLCCELALCGSLVEQRTLPFGAHRRFAERVAASENLAFLPTADRTSESAIGNPGMRKKSFLHMAPVSAARTKKANGRSQVETTVAAASKAVAARITGLF
jgi:hypothetical protein